MEATISKVIDVNDITSTIQTAWSVEHVKKVAIAINRPLTRYWPQFNRSETLHPISTEDGYKMEESFYMNNGVIAFVSDGVLYVIPYMHKVMGLLYDCGFTRRSLYVPFSNWDYPVELKAQWDALNEVAQLSA